MSVNSEDKMQTTRKLQLVTLNIPCELLDKFDRAILNKYQDRSEAIRQAMREFLDKMEAK